MRGLPAAGDPVWTEEDRTVALVWQSEQAVKCGGCGLPADETMAPEAEGDYVATKVRCHACAARSAAAENFTGTGGGFYWALERR